MKMAISLLDTDFERYERLARRHGMTRSAFYRTAAQHFADELEGSSGLTALADAALAAAVVRDAGRDDALFVAESERIRRDGDSW